MVRKGSPVRVRQRALDEDPAATHPEQMVFPDATSAAWCCDECMPGLPGACTAVEPPLSTPVLPRISPDGRWLLHADLRERGVVQRTATPGGRLLGTTHGLSGLVRDSAVSCSPDTRRLVVAAAGRRNGMWIAA